MALDNVRGPIAKAGQALEEVPVCQVFVGGSHGRSIVYDISSSIALVDIEKADTDLACDLLDRR